MMSHLKIPTVNNTNQGFSLVEVLMAALVMMGLLIGTNRVVMQGMAASSKAGLRRDLEQEILNDIESIQAIDTMLNAEPKLTKACNEGKGNSSSYLAAQIPTANNIAWERTLDINNPSLLRITYSFEIPGRSNSQEKRIIELNPSFYSSCQLAL